MKRLKQCADGLLARIESGTLSDSDTRLASLLCCDAIAAMAGSAGLASAAKDVKRRIVASAGEPFGDPFGVGYTFIENTLTGDGRLHLDPSALG